MLIQDIGGKNMGKVSPGDARENNNVTLKQMLGIWPQVLNNGKLEICGFEITGLC